jgi:hypothetical protein
MLSSETCTQAVLIGFLTSVLWVQVSICIQVIPAVSYLFIGLVGCSMDLGLVVVRVSWPGHPGLSKKQNTMGTRFNPRSQKI